MSLKFTTYFTVGRTPASAPDPLVRLCHTLKAEADGGVGRGHCAEQPGGPPHVATFFNGLRMPDTSE